MLLNGLIFLPLSPNFKVIGMENIHMAIFASGSGTNARAIIEYFRNNSRINVVLIVTNRENAGVIEIAKANEIPFVVLKNQDLNNREITITALQNAKVNFIVLAGFLLKIPEYLVKEYAHRMINIHPALLPNYGGKGMYGKHVHEAVIKNKEEKSGITVHFVTEEYDEGNIIFQKEFPLTENESCESLEQKIHELEHKYFPSVIEQVIESL